MSIVGKASHEYKVLDHRKRLELREVVDCLQVSPIGDQHYRHNLHVKEGLSNEIAHLHFEEGGEVAAEQLHLQTRLIGRHLLQSSVEKQAKAAAVFHLSNHQQNDGTLKHLHTCASRNKFLVEVVLED